MKSAREWWLSCAERDFVLGGEGEGCFTGQKEQPIARGSENGTSLGVRGGERSRKPH